MSTKLNQLLLTRRNVFNLTDLGTIWGQAKRTDTVQSARDYAARGLLIRLKRGVYALAGYDPLQLAQKLEPLSYLSGITALAFHGLSFQSYQQIQAAALKTRVHTVAEQQFSYHQLQPAIFFHPLGLQSLPAFTIASPERAICDLLYWQADFPFENLTKINWNLLTKISRIYKQKTLKQKIKRLERNFCHASS
jgi:hypothetical protein